MAVSQAPRLAVPIADAVRAFNAAIILHRAFGWPSKALNLHIFTPAPRDHGTDTSTQGAKRVMATGIVKKRCFLCIGGYEPIGPEWWHQRFIRELKRFEATWSAASAVSEAVVAADGAVATWTIDSRGANWRVETDHCLLRWDDFVATDFKRSKLERLPKGIATLAGFIFSGTAYRYVRTSFRYFLFFLYPLVLLAALILAAVLVPYLLAGFGVPLAVPVATLIAIAAFIGFLYWPGRFLMFDYMLDDWIFAGEFIRRDRAGVSERMDRFARELVERARDPSYDEVVLSGQSLGGAWIVAVAARALQLDPELGGHGPSVWLMSTGSSLLKVGLHPKAGWLRDATAAVADAKHVKWIDYQAIVDVISFYGANPVEAMGLGARENPAVQKVRMRKMLAPATYKRFWGNFFRLHRQFVMGNEVRYFYDYFQICCGPVPLERRIAQRDKLLEAFAPDGAYADAMPQAAAAREGQAGS